MLLFLYIPLRNDCRVVTSIEAQLYNLLKFLAFLEANRLFFLEGNILPRLPSYLTTTSSTNSLHLFKNIKTKRSGLKIHIM